jgi:hypothetical protein
MRFGSLFYSCLYKFATGLKNLLLFYNEDTYIINNGFRSEYNQKPSTGYLYRQ